MVREKTIKIAQGTVPCALLILTVIAVMVLII